MTQSQPASPRPAELLAPEAGAIIEVGERGEIDQLARDYEVASSVFGQVNSRLEERINNAENSNSLTPRNIGLLEKRAIKNERDELSEHFNADQLERYDRLTSLNPFEVLEAIEVAAGIRMADVSNQQITEIVEEYVKVRQTGPEHAIAVETTVEELIEMDLDTLKALSLSFQTEAVAPRRAIEARIEPKREALKEAARKQREKFPMGKGRSLQDHGPEDIYRPPKVEGEPLAEEELREITKEDAAETVKVVEGIVRELSGKNFNRLSPGTEAAERYARIISDSLFNLLSNEQIPDGPIIESVYEQHMLKLKYMVLGMVATGEHKDDLTENTSILSLKTASRRGSLTRRRERHSSNPTKQPTEREYMVLGRQIWEDTHPPEKPKDAKAKSDSTSHLSRPKKMKAFLGRKKAQLRDDLSSSQSTRRARGVRPQQDSWQKGARPVDQKVQFDRNSSARQF